MSRTANDVAVGGRSFRHQLLHSPEGQDGNVPLAGLVGGVNRIPKESASKKGGTQSQSSAATADFTSGDYVNVRTPGWSGVPYVIESIYHPDKVRTVT